MQNNRVILCLSAVLVVFSACSNPSEQTPKEEEQPQTIEGFVAADENFVLMPKKRQEMKVLGRYYKAKPEELKTLIIGTAREVNDIILDKKCIINGPIMAVYQQLPKEGVIQDIFVGIPINKTISQSNYETMRIPKGKFHKAKTNASIGESSNLWKQVSKRVKADGFKLEPPYIEYPSDTRNAEMTTVVTQANLLLPYIK